MKIKAIINIPISSTDDDFNKDKKPPKNSKLNFCSRIEIILFGLSKKFNAGIINVIPSTSNIVANKTNKLILYKSKVFFFPIIKWILLINFMYFII